MAKPFRLDSDLTTAWFHYLLDQCKAQPDPFAIHVGGSLKFAKSSEQLREIFLCYASSSVQYMYD